MSTASFTITYSGPALDSSKMDVRELAPALLAFGSLLEESNRVLNGNTAALAVKVKRFEMGLFGITFEVSQQLIDSSPELFMGDMITAATSLTALLGFSAASSLGLWQLLKKADGQIPRTFKRLDDGHIEIQFQGDSAVVSGKVVDLYRDLKVRKEIENTLKPLDNNGIERLEIWEGGKIINYADAGDIHCFSIPDFKEEIIYENERITLFSIVSLNFNEGDKWCLSDGITTFYVTVKDEEFLRKVDDNLVYFSKGDILTVKLVTRTWETQEGIRTEYEVIKVLEHKSAAKQLSFPFEYKL
jgi:hypothetical protein